MLKLKTTAAACLALSAIGGILAFAIHSAASRDVDSRASVATTATAQGTLRPLTEVGQTTDSPLPPDNQIAQVFRRRAVRSGAQNMPLAGVVKIAGSPVAGATVTLYAAGTGAPKQLAQGKTNGNGMFKLDAGQAPEGSVLYTVAKGGTPMAAEAKGPNEKIRLLAVLGTAWSKKVTVNEFTTIASAMTCAQFLNGDALGGKSLGLRIAAGNVPNFVDLETGGYGATIADALNSAQTPTMANFATLASLMAGASTQVQPDACSRFLAAATSPSGSVPTDTLTAVETITRYPWHQPEKVFALLDDFYPIPKGKNLRPTPFMPYLSWAPSAWIFPLKFTGGGYSAAGKMMVDSEGNVWTGDNWLVGAQNQDSLWDGNLSKFAPNGKPLSPSVTGFTGGGVEGVGFGLAIDAQDNCWVTTYGSKTIAKFNKAGKPLSPPEGYNFGGKLGLMQGIIATPSGDIWALDLEHSAVVFMPKGDPAKGRLLFVNKTRNPKENPGHLLGPFHLAIDQQDRIWVSNAAGDWLSRFPASDPSPGKVETFKTGFSPSGLAVDSKGNVWVTCRLGTSDKGKAVLEQMIQAVEKGRNPDPIITRALSGLRTAPEGGSITVFGPDGKEAPCSPISGHGLVGPWAAAVDGDDNVWISNFGPATAGIVQLCGVNPKAWPPGKKMGDAISPPGGYVGGGMQMLIDIDVDPAGNVWVDNNWQNIDAALDRAAEPLSTLGAGQGVVVFYGLAKPVRTPLIGPVQQPSSSAGGKGKWFAAAKDAGYLDIALECARDILAEPSTLIRAGRDFAEKEPAFAAQVSLCAIKHLLNGRGYEPTERDILDAYKYLTESAARCALTEWANNQVEKLKAEGSSPGAEPMLRALATQVRRARVDS